MRNHKFLSALAVLMLLGMLLAACGSSTPAAAPTSAPAAAEPTAAPAAAEPTTAPAAAEPTAAPAAAEPTAAPAASGTPDKVTLQLKWVTQAQFAGYYAALDQGYYEEEGLDVTIKPGGPDITPEQVVASGGADFGINWMPSLLATRDKGGNLVNVAQVFARSAMLELAWKDSGIADISDLRGKKVGVWCCGNEFELLAALNKSGINPKDKSDVTMVNQPF